MESSGYPIDGTLQLIEVLVPTRKLNITQFLAENAIIILNENFRSSW